MKKIDIMLVNAIIRTNNVNLVTVVNSFDNLSKDSSSISFLQFTVSDDKIHDLDV